jgi:hypothetical protein
MLRAICFQQARTREAFSLIETALKIKSQCAGATGFLKPIAAKKREARRSACHFRPGYSGKASRGAGQSRKCPVRDEASFPDTAFCLTYEAIVDRRRRTVFWRAIGAPAASLQDMHVATDDASAVYMILAEYIHRQMRLYLAPLIVVRPNQVASHPLHSESSKQRDQQPIQPARILLGSHPSITVAF